MSWLRLDDQFHRHRKVAPLSDAAFRLHVTVMLECAAQLTEGRIDAVLLPTLPQAPQGKKLTEAIGALEKSGLWHREGDVYVVHDYLDWNPSAAEVLGKRDAAKERMRRAREEKARLRAEAQERRQQENIARSSPPVRANEERSSLNPVPVPVPVPNPDSEGGAESDIHTRARLALQDPFRARYTQPNRWPEVVEAANVIHEALGLRPPKLGTKDPALNALLEIFAAGHTLEEIREAAPRLLQNEWFAGVRKLHAVTLSVFREALESRPLAQAAGSGWDDD